MNEQHAARALVAYFNHEMATRLVRRVLKEKSQEAWQRLADAVLDMVPAMAKERTSGVVGQYVEDAGRDYAESAAFQAKADAYIKANADSWLQKAMERVVGERAGQRVTLVLKGWEMQQYEKAILGRLQSAMDAEVQRLAKERVAALVDSAGKAGEGR